MSETWTLIDTETDVKPIGMNTNTSGSSMMVSVVRVRVPSGRSFVVFRPGILVFFIEFSRRPLV